MWAAALPLAPPGMVKSGIPMNASRTTRIPRRLFRATAWIALVVAAAPAAGADGYRPWQADGLAIPEPLGGLEGDPERGRAIARDRSRGNCLACHHMPIPEASDHGTVGPPLYGVGARLSEAELRLRVVDEKRVNPETIMPAFYRHPDRLNRPLAGFDRTILTAQEVEDVVAYLTTLKGAQ